ncbi:hypothetical protein MLD38_010401 [Melastoma candidum]|uniref:Uncharacterized protein n=1 Tax=Melastoma candidum TaxID=119954 RepID=A0ACB9QZR7_9MYRT|nr:hypothetical protein MLD38_010401 [Melastoma candidum]
MAGFDGAMAAVSCIGMTVNDVVSFVVFCFLDVLDVVLCVVYRVADFFIEAERKPCYCSSSRESIAIARGAIS